MDTDTDTEHNMGHDTNIDTPTRQILKITRHDINLCI